MIRLGTGAGGSALSLVIGEEIVINGIEILPDDADRPLARRRQNRPTVRVVVHDGALWNRIIEERWVHITSRISRFTRDDAFSWCPLPHAVSLSRRAVQLSIPGGAPARELPLDLTDYEEIFRRLLSKQSGYSCRLLPEERFVYISPPLSVPERRRPILGKLREVESSFRHVHESTVTVLESVVPRGAVTVRFDFPEFVRIPCEQYLLFFAQFLKDVGIEAVADLRHNNAGEVLFTVNPTASDQALEKIYQALTLYLRLPASPTIGLTSVFDQPLEVQRLAAQVQHMQSQLTFANMMLQTQQKTIQAQEATILAQQELIDRRNTLLAPEPITAEVFVESVKAITVASRDQDKEKILGGALEVTRLEGTGFTVNLPLMLRWVKRNLLGEQRGEEDRHSGV